ncbi:hypothetical protein [Asticcacaulis sp. EMRT-3]|uniref:hypothetical protein n=1 Tax=Asticcacaulis sp. EMRT-3 TaxID=3040349 RepID=UPI0024AF4065|nr:hypothetical protein [Asticcacaulis sp. EMRT-3]MDI7775339.1 hypothetical protein [Asticcacaulis sp. EMRT-3]
MRPSDIDLPSLSILMRRVMEARQPEDRDAAFRLLRAHLLPHVETRETDEAAKPIRLYLDRLSRLSSRSEPWLDIFRALQRAVEAYAMPSAAIA